MKNRIILGVLTLALSNLCFAQQQTAEQELLKEIKEKMEKLPPKLRHDMREMIEEKTRIAPEQIKEKHFSSDSYQNGSYQTEDKNEEKKDEERVVKLFKDNAQYEETGVATGSAVESEIHAAINPTDSNNMVVSAIYQSDQSQLYCTIYYTKDFGKTWKKSDFTTIPKKQGLRTIGGGDPFFAFDKAGKCYLSWINLSLTGTKNSDSGYFSLVWASSSNGGATWDRPANDVIAVGAMPAVYVMNGLLTKGFDKQWMTFDKTESKYQGNLYCVYYKIDATADVPNSIGLRKKAANSNEFSSDEINITSDNFDIVQFASCEVAPNGNVHVTFMGQPTDGTKDLGLWHCVSTDGAETFSEPQRVSSLRVPRFSSNFTRSDTILGVSSARTIPCPQFAIDNSSKSTRGNLYLSWTAFGITKKEANGADIYFSRSTDNGANWSKPIIVNNDARGVFRHNFYSSMTCNSEGLLTINWYDKRDDATHKATHYYYAISRDGGQTFEGNLPVTSLSADFSKIGSRNNTFGIGEYNNTVSTKNYAIPFWADGRKNSGDIDIYCAKISLSGTTGVHEINSVSGSNWDLQVLPNITTTKKVTLQFNLLSSDNQKIAIEIIDNMGKVIRTIKDNFKVGLNNVAVDLNGYATGNYYVKITNEKLVEYKEFRIVN